MKLLIFAASFFPVSDFAHADTEMLTKMLQAPEVIRALDRVDNYVMEYTAVNESTSWTFTAVFLYDKPAKVEGDLDTITSCTLTASITSIGGVAGPVESGARTSESCAEAL